MKNLIATLLMFIVLTSISFAGLKLEFSNYEEGNKDNAETNYAIFTTDNLKIEDNSSNGKTTMIFYSKKNKIVILNHKEKTYMILTKQMINNFKKQISSQMEQFKQQFANLPEAQRKQMEKMLEGRMGGKTIVYSVEKTSETKKVNSWNTTKYNLKANDEMKSEIWAAPFSTLGISVSDISIMEKFSDFTRELLEGIPGVNKDPFSAIYDELKGIPVMTKSNTTEKVTELVSVNKYNANDNDFKIPSEYTETKMQMPGINR